RLDPVRGPPEERVPEDGAQLAEGAAHRRLGHAHPARRAGDAALVEEGLEGGEEVEVDGAVVHAPMIFALSISSITNMRWMAFTGRRRFLLTTAIGPSPKESVMSHEITIQELRNKMASNSVVLVEALPPAAFASGHLPGALNLPMDRVDVDAPGRLPERDAEIVV